MAGVICRMTAGPTTYQSPLAKRPQAYELDPRSKTICVLEPVDVYLMSVPVHMPAVGGGGGGGGSGGGGGGVVPTTVVAAENASVEPRALVAVTRERRRQPTSPAETGYMEDSAPRMGVQVAPVESQRSHAYA